MPHDGMREPELSHGDSRAFGGEEWGMYGAPDVRVGICCTWKKKGEKRTELKRCAASVLMWRKWAPN